MTNDFLQRLENYDVGSKELAEYIARGENHYAEIQDYLNTMDVNFVNRVVDEARLICVYDSIARDFVAKSPLGRFV